MDINERLIVPLDVDTADEAQQIIEELGEMVGTYKIGLQLFTREGHKVVKKVKQMDKKVFLDLKFHDIPNTVANSVKAAFDLGADMLTIHSMGGFSMMEGVAKLLWQWKDHGKNPPIIFAVTVLTSLDAAFLEDVIGTTGRTMDEEVVILAKAAQSAGLGGVVASPKEIRTIREACGKDLLILTPGIRPAGSDADDQARTATPADAVRDGADYIVVGRPILNSPDRRLAAQSIIREMESAL